MTHHSGPTIELVDASHMKGLEPDWGNPLKVYDHKIVNKRN